MLTAAPASADVDAAARSVAAAVPSSVTEVTRSAKGTTSAEAYWTPERLASALPADEAEAAFRGTDAGTPAPAPEPVIRHATATAPAHQAAAQRAVLLNESITVGKIFYTSSTDGRDYYCSASVINSTARNMVFTAAHCLHDGPGRTWHTANWIFAPSYRNGARPYGTWTWTTLAVPTGWINTRERQYDVGVALVTASQRIVDVVGGNGLLTGGGRSYHYDIFGYPSNRDGGEVQWVCSGTSYDAGSNRIQMNCSWGGGSSGGPWYYSYNDTLRIGDVHGVTSYTNDANNPTYIGSPYFSDAVVGTLYRTYANRTS